MSRVPELKGIHRFRSLYLCRLLLAMLGLVFRSW